MSDFSEPTPPSESKSKFLGYDIRSQLDVLTLLVARIGVGVTLESIASLLAGLVCAGIAVITFGRLYRREF